MADETIRGGRELAQFLMQLPAKVEKNIMRSALRAGAGVFREEIKEQIPVVSGDLRRSVRVSTRSKGGTVTAYVRIGNKKAWYAQMVEFGTRPHKITPERAKALRVAGYIVSDVDHPGATARPVVRPAFDSKSGEAIAAVAAQVRRRLTNEGINVPAPETP